MAGADSGADSGVGPEWRWDVALSFASAQRDYVEQVAEVLKARGVRCFYDADEQIELWGKYLAEELSAIYGEQAAAVVVFVSAEYAARDWTRLERRAALNRAVRERREYVLPARFDDTPLPGLLSDMVAVDLRGRTPQQLAEMIIDKLAALRIAAPDASADARGASQHAGSARPSGAVRVGQADPRRLGVHAAISVPGVSDEALPEYVPRDTDAAESGIRAKVAGAAKQGGLVLLVGGSSVGKTRCAFEAVTALLPEWWLVHPGGPAEVAELARAPVPRMVVWLDELQRYLDGEHGLTGGVVRALLNAPHSAVVIGTMWPDLYAAYTSVPAPGGPDPRAREREVLDLADVVRIDPEFGAAEQGRARAAAARDPRLQVALDATDYGLTQTLAAAPQLVARWYDAKTVSPHAWAVLTVALDATRLGARAPLRASFLRAAAPGYCTSQQQAEAPENWFAQALAYATGKLHGAAAALSPAGEGMGRIAGYTVADYLVQHATRERRSARVPASTWDAFLSHIRDPADAIRLADSARNRLLYRYALPLYRRADKAGPWGLALLLADRGDLDEAVQIVRARARADGDKGALLLAELLAEPGGPEAAVQILRTLRARADAGALFDDSDLARLLEEHGDLDQFEQIMFPPGLLARRGDLDELRARACAGDGLAAWQALQLADLLSRRGDPGKAEQISRARAIPPHYGAWQRARELALYGDLDQLRARADAGDRVAAGGVARRLARRGHLDELRARADAGDKAAAWQLARLLAERGDLDELRARADAGDGLAAWRLAHLLAERGDLDELRARADAGDGLAAPALADLLADRGDPDEAEQIVRARAVAGDEAAARALIKQGRGNEAERLRRFGLNPDGSIAHA